MTDINPGDVVTVSTDPGFKDADGVLTDPTQVSLRWKVAGGPETLWVFGTDAEIVRDSVGLFHADIPVTVAGRYHFRWKGTGAVIAAEEGYFDSVTSFGSA